MFWLCKQLLQLKRRHPELRESGVVIFDEDPLLLRAVNVDLCDFGDQEDLVAHVLCDFFELGIAEAFAGEGEDRPEHVAELVIDIGAERVRRQIGLHILHFAPKLVPDGPHIVVAFENAHDEDGDTRLRLRLHEIELRHFLNRLFELIRHELLDTLRASPWKISDDLGHTHGETAILRPRRARERLDAGKYDHPECDGGHPILLDGDARQALAAHDVTLTSSPSVIWLIPAMTTRSPSSSPASTSRPSPVRAPTVTGCRRIVPMPGSVVSTM